MVESLFDVFEKGAYGMIWFATARSLEHANELIRTRASGGFGEFLIVSLATGDKMVLVVNERESY